MSDELTDASASNVEDKPFDVSGPSSAEVEIYDPALFRKALEIEESDVSFLGPAEEMPLPYPVTRTTEGEIWAKCLHQILSDPRGHRRPMLRGSDLLATNLIEATATMGHFAAVTGIIERAVVQSARTKRPIKFPPICVVSPPGVGKTHYCQSIALALATTCIPIAINGTSDRGQLGGLSPAWRGAKLGKLAKGLLIDSISAAPLFLLDEIDKAPSLVAGENTLDVLLSALEPANARAFVDEYLDIPIRLESALWIASANDTRSIPKPLLSRMIVIDISMPSKEQAMGIVRAIVAPILLDNDLEWITEDAVDLLSSSSARQARQALEIASAFAIYERRYGIGLLDVRRSLSLLRRPDTQVFGFLARDPRG